MDPGTLGAEGHDDDSDPPLEQAGHPSEKIEFVLIRHDDVNKVEELRWERPRRGRVQHGRRPHLSSAPERGLDRVEGNLKLGKYDLTGSGGARGTQLVRARNHHDRVLTGVGDENQRSSGGNVDNGDLGGVNARFASDPGQRLSGVVRSDCADESRG